MENLKCPVCGNLLTKGNNTYKCKKNHSFDISKYGYTNLLLANQSRSLNPGDDKEMVLARKRFFELDKYACLKIKLLDILLKYCKQEEYLCDIACGEGYYTNYLHSKLSNNIDIKTVGSDISKYAILEASKQKNKLQLNNINYVIANLSNMPFMDKTFSTILNCFAPLDVEEFNRLLKDEGLYIRVLPGPKHLWGLKQVLYEEPYINASKEEIVDNMELLENIIIEKQIYLETNQEIWDLFMMTPYFYKTSNVAKEKLKQVDSLETTISFNIRVYKKKVNN